MKHRTRQDFFAVVSLVILATLGRWSQFFGDAQPVGGDKTNFSYGLMAHYAQSIRHGELNEWNELWGFGFPGFAESQTGSLYPIHLILYYLMPALDAFRWNLLLHRILAALASYAAFRGISLRPAGAWVATVAFVGGGFVVGHLDHQWAVLSLPWLPAIIWATDRWMKEASRLAAATLPLFTACQLLIGHYQVAFMAQATAALLALLCLIHATRTGAGGGFRPSAFRAIAWMGLTAAGFAMAAVQLVPTYCLQAYVRAANPLVEGEQFLSTHALPPWMIGQSIFPALYFREPLWRAVVWTPARTAPEECLGYVGLLPVALAFGGAWKYRRSPFVRHWTFISLVGLYLSAGSFAPGYDTLISLPGFSFFRSAARWTLIVHLALALIAGWTFDRVCVRRVLRWLIGLAVVATIFAVVVGAWWGFFHRAASLRTSPPAAMTWMVQCLIPGAGPEAARAMAMEMARPKSWDEYTIKTWSAMGRPSDRLFRLIDQWPDVFRREILPTLAVFATTLALLFVASRIRRRHIRIVVMVALLGDMAIFAALFPDATIPIERIAQRGPVLEALSKLPHGARVISPGSNLLMAFGQAPAQAYRTLDVALPQPVENLFAEINAAAGAPVDPSRGPYRLLDIQAVVGSPFLTPKGMPDNRLPAGLRAFDDFQLDDWIDGGPIYPRAMMERGFRVRTSLYFPPRGSRCFVLPRDRLRVDPKPVNASTLGGPIEVGPSWIGLYEPRQLQEVGAAKLVRSSSRERAWSITTTAPAIAVFGELMLPGWRARITDIDKGDATASDANSGTAGASRGNAPANAVGAVEKYWQAVALDQPGKFHIELEYRTPGLNAGMRIALAAFGCWLAAVAIALIRSHRRPQRQ